MTSLSVVILLHAVFLTWGSTTVEGVNCPDTADTASVAGQAVIAETGDAASRARIALKDQYGVETVAATVTDAQGAFRLPAVPSGTYSVEARHGFADEVELVLLSRPIQLTDGTLQLTVYFSERLVDVHREHERLRREREEARRQGVVLMGEPELPLRLLTELRQSGMGGILDEAGQNLVSAMQIEEGGR